MDFGTLLHMAKKNSQDTKNDGKYYSTKYAPPKKESKEKKLSENIQKFLQKKEQEEKRKQQEQQEKLNQLLSMRDEKSKNKIRKMLKVTKSANRSVLEDAVNTEHTAVTMQGPEQPDQDDYGYVSTEANSFYQKYIEKVKDIKEDKGFSPSRPQSVKDLSGTKERVKAALTREIDEKNNHTRQRVSHIKETSSSSTGTNVARLHHSSSKPIYDPEAEKRQEEQERKKRDAEKKKHKKPPPPPMDFQALLKLAEKKQHEPIDVPVEIKKKEPERLMTLKEKQEMEERQKAKEARERRDRERSDDNTKCKRPDKEKGTSFNSSTPQRMEPNGRIPKLNLSNNASNNASSKLSSISSTLDKKSTSSLLDKKLSSNASFAKSSTTASSSSNNKSSSLNSYSAKSSSKLVVPLSSNNKSTLNSASSSAFSKSALSSSSSSSKQHNIGLAKELSSRDINAVKSREFPPRDVQKTRQFPPTDVRRGPGPTVSKYDKYGDSKKSATSKRRILDDDDSEYDSELDDFIDDGDEEEDYSSHIKAIFGYDKSRYRDEDFDDRNMESNFAQVQREEYISKKIGIKEDLEDMKQEALEKKRKMMMKKRRLN